MSDTPSARLAALGLNLPKAAAPVATYVLLPVQGLFWLFPASCHCLVAHSGSQASWARTCRLSWGVNVPNSAC